MIKGREIVDLALECPSEKLDVFVKDLDIDARKPENAMALCFMLIDALKNERRKKHGKYERNARR